MKKIIVYSLLSLSTTFVIAGGTRTHGNASRPVYSGTHTTSHGGIYNGGSGGSSHKGGHYTAPNGYKGYGKHTGK